MLRHLLPLGAPVPRIRGSLRRDVARLARFWAAFIAVLLTGALVLQILGPPLRPAPTPEPVASAGVGNALNTPANAEPEPAAPPSADRAMTPLALAPTDPTEWRQVGRPPANSQPDATTPEMSRSVPSSQAPPAEPSAPTETEAAAPPARDGMPSSGAPATSAPAADAQGQVTALSETPARATSPDAPPEAPEMVAVAGGTFRMGSGEDATEAPLHTVTVKPFLMAKYPVTIRQWNACVAAKMCDHVADGPDDAPISNVSWTDAHRFIAWLSQASQQHYRLPSEAEWEYAARGGTETRYWWGNAMKAGLADCKGCGGPRAGVQPEQVGALSPNPFGLYDVGGGIEEWVEDCWHKDYRGAPVDGSAWLAGDCREHVLRGGSWRDDSSDVRSASRNFYDATVRYPGHGLRLARSQ